jgi:membrane protease YdiL (CAAX protease family)
MVGAMLVASFAAVFPFALYVKLTDNPPVSRLMSILENAPENGDYVWINFVVALPFVAAVMAVALILRQGCPAREYLAIRNARARNWILWPLALAAFSMGADALLYTLDIDPVAPWMTDVYNSATCFSCLMIAVVLIAPLIEELIFRGFVFTGIQARLGSFWAVIFSSLPWAIIHLQYREWYFIVLIFMLGLLFSIARWRTNSVLVPVAMHMFQNAMASVQMYFVS